jgi:transcriptional regulator with XRE-family HTH domain
VKHEAFPSTLQHFRQREGWSYNALAQEIGVDPSYVSRIARGDRERPRQPVVEALAEVMELTVPERNRLLLTAGYAPLSVEEVLQHAELSPEERTQCQSVVQTIAATWRPPLAALLVAELLKDGRGE